MGSSIPLFNAPARGTIMVGIKQTITPCLLFDAQAEEAANFYTSVFDNARIKHVSRYGRAGQDVHGKAPGSVMVVEFESDGQTFTALDGESQDEIDSPRKRIGANIAAFPGRSAARSEAQWCAADPGS
jgi:hypothetical protein